MTYTLSYIGTRNYRHILIISITYRSHKTNTIKVELIYHRSSGQIAYDPICTKETSKVVNDL